MRFSIIIPLYNKEEYISETLDSVKQQTFHDYEVIVVNDCSTDNSLNIAKAYEEDSRFHVYTKNNGGVSAARNFGINRAQGEYVCFLDADDLWKSTFLEEADGLLRKYGNRDFLCFGYDAFERNIDNIVRHSNLKRFFEDDDRLIDFYEYSVKKKCSVALTSAVVIKKKRLQELDYCYPIGISIGEDVDLWVRAAAKEYIIYSNKPMMLYRSFTDGGLTVKFSDNINKNFPYWKWYSMECFSLYKNMFTTRMVYALALKALNVDGVKVRYILQMSRGYYLIFNRLALYILSFFKSVKNKLQ